MLMILAPHTADLHLDHTRKTNPSEVEQEVAWQGVFILQIACSTVVQIDQETPSGRALECAIVDDANDLHRRFPDACTAEVFDFGAKCVNDGVLEVDVDELLSNSVRLGEIHPFRDVLGSGRIATILRTADDGRSVEPLRIDHEAIGVLVWKGYCRFVASAIVLSVGLEKLGRPVEGGAMDGECLRWSADAASNDAAGSASLVSGCRCGWTAGLTRRHGRQVSAGLAQSPSSRMAKSSRRSRTAPRKCQG